MRKLTVDEASFEEGEEWDWYWCERHRSWHSCYKGEGFGRS